MRFDWYSDLVLAGQLVHEVYGWSLDAIRADVTSEVLTAWLDARASNGRSGAGAIRVWQGGAAPSTFPADGREVWRYGFATAVAPRPLQSMCCLASARRILTREGGPVRRGRGRPRPLVLEWRAGAQLAATYGDGGWRDATALIDDLERAMLEVGVERVIGQTADSLPRAQLRALSGLDAAAARSALESARPQTAASGTITA